MSFFKKLSLFAGRFFLSFIFLISALRKIFSWQDVENSLVNQIVEWNSYISSNSVKDFLSEILPWAPLFLLIAMFLELLGSILLLLGIKPRIGAFFLIIFLFPTTIIMHPFWFFDGTQKEIEFVMFIKNLSILGGLLIALAQGGVMENNKLVYPKVKFDK